MAIPNKIISADQIQDGFRKVNQTIDNIVTGITFIASSTTLTLTKVNEQPLSINLPIFNHYTDYYYFSIYNNTFDVYYNYSDSLSPLRDTKETYTGFTSNNNSFTSVTSSMTIPNNFNQPFVIQSGYYWKDGSFIALGQGNHYFFLPTFPYSKKGFSLIFGVINADYSGNTINNSVNLWVYQTQNGIDTEPATLIKLFGNPTFSTFTLIWTGTRWNYIGWTLNSSLSSPTLFG